MVCDGSLAFAKIDRPKGIINFAKRKPAEEVSLLFPRVLLGGDGVGLCIEAVMELTCHSFPSTG